jgi:hypothetical protein
MKKRSFFFYFFLKKKKKKVKERIKNVWGIRIDKNQKDGVLHDLPIIRIACWYMDRNEGLRV